jgi:RHS repeat-associated protein
MIKKRIPGNTGSPGDYTMTYDNLDRLIQTIDPKGTKSYITYDVFSRPIVTGIYISGTPTWQTKTVYDTYNPGTDYSSTYPYQNIYGITRETAVKGKVTITINKVIDAAGDMKAELATVAYYDKYGRVIQSVSDNHKSGRDRISHKYKYKDSDLIAETRYDHGISGTTVSRSVVEKFAYDLSGRLKSTKHWINGQTDTTSLATMTYNEEGQLITKNINTLQTAAYKYNIRGWLTCINTPNIYSSSNLFALQLYYTGNSYNGNITKMDWMNVTGGYLVKSYEFSYDKLNRLTAGAYSEYDNHAYLPNSAGKYNESFSYDANGNIKTALRNGIIDDGTGLIGSIDNLNYKYFNSDKSNRLYAVGDYITDVSGRGDFNESGSDGFATQEYMYDNNGNMYRDYNRKSILSYNYLNLPNWVEDLNGNRIFTFYYSASGVKLRQQIYVDKYNSTGKYDYIGPFVYKDGVLNHIITSEGRARFSNGSFACYEFYLKDHLGNVRTVFEKNGSVPQVLQKNDYYAFGGLMGESTDATAYSNKYLYNGKEQVSTTNSPLGIDVSWYAYGARFYDPQLGRWHSIDPLTENTPSINPYQYCYNDPIKFFDRFGLAGETDIYGRPKYDENGIYIAPMDRQGGMTAKGYGDANYGHWTTKTTSIDIDGQYMCNKSENKEGEEIWELTYLPPIIGEKTTHLFWEWYNYSLPVASGGGGEFGGYEALNHGGHITHLVTGGYEAAISATLKDIRQTVKLVGTEAEVAKLIGNIGRVAKFTGYAGEAVVVFANGYNVVTNPTAENYARAGISGLAIGVNALNFVVPGLGLGLSLGITAIDAAGGFDWFYDSFK